MPDDFESDESSTAGNSPRSSWLAILFTLVVAGMVAVGTFVLVSPLLVIVPLFAAAALVQYLLWGWWFERYYAQYKAELEAEEREERKRG